LLSSKNFIQSFKEKLILLGVDIAAEYHRVNHIVVYCEPSKGVISYRENCIMFIDAYIGAFNADEIFELNNDNCKVFRPEMHILIHSTISALVSVSSNYSSYLYQSDIWGIPVASGGVVARYGTVIVDSISRPTKVYGVANGCGALVESNKLTDELRKNYKMVDSAIKHRLLNRETI